MNTHSSRWALLSVLVAVLLAGLILWLGRTSAVGNTTEPIDRHDEPIVVTGADLDALQGTPTDELFVYAYRDHSDAMEQIPFQVDVKDSGAYVSTVGTPLDDDDEVVFMASDLGGQAPAYELPARLPIGDTWYRLEVNDPLSPGSKGWAYVVRSTSLTRSFTETYTTYDSDNNQILTPHYTVGFAPGFPGIEYLALNESGVDILDRTKIRVSAFIGTFNEEQIGSLLGIDPLTVIKAGPVRVLATGGVVGYRSTLEQSLVAELPISLNAARFSTDFNEHAEGSTLYNANTSAGVTIDGMPDPAVGLDPFSPWWQVSGETGTLMQVANSSGLGGTQTSYYKDDATIDTDDTGDQRSYGDTGIEVDSPNDTIDYRTTLYVLPPDQDNVGEQYAAYFAEPLEVTAVQGEACPVPVQSVSISGPDSGHINVDYDFTVLVDPSDATQPLDYAWSSDGLAEGAGTANVVYRWATTGTHVVSMTVQNCGGVGSASDSQPVVLSELPDCDYPLTGVSLSGPSSGDPGETLIFTANPEPSHATPPITYTWSSDGLVSHDGEQASYRWTSVGESEVQVTGRNCSGQDYDDSLTVKIGERIYLPLVVRQ